MTALRERLPSMPYRYMVHSAMNDYQVTIEGPAGRAIITEIDGGEDYEVATMFHGEPTQSYSVRDWYGDASPLLAIDRLMFKTNVYLVNRGAEIPSDVAPRRAAWQIIAVLLGVLILAGIVHVAVGRMDDDGRQPTAPITYTPAQTLETTR